MNDNMDPSEDLEMARPAPFTMNEYCRICANKGDNMMPIYADEGADHRLETKIKIHLPFLNICIDDVLPKKICYSCASTLLVWDELFASCTVANEKLRNWFGSSSYNIRECKTVSFDDIGGLNSGTEYEEISDVNIFKNKRSDKTLNETDKISSISKVVLCDELKSSVIQEDKKLSSNMKSDMADVFNRTMDDDDDDDSVEHMYTTSIDNDDMNRLMDCHRLDMSASVDYGGVMLKEEFLDGSISKRELGGDENGDRCQRDGDAFPNVVEVFQNDKKCEEADNDDDDDDDDDEEEDEGRIISLDFRDMYLSAGNHAETICEICATVFKTRYNLLRHFQKRHPEYKMFECDLCRINFPNIDVFKNHLEKEHSRGVHATESVDSKQVRFACDVCGNMYKNKASAMNHLLTHTAKKTVQCTRCDFSCYTKQQLSVHQTKHDKRFVCDLCCKRFAQKSQLDVHVNAVHYNQRPFSCVLCKKTFKTKGSHDAHMVVHTDTRNYQCPHCDKKCRKRYDLTLHIRTHTGEKPFKCSVCGRGFVQMCDTRKHEMLHFKRNKKKTVYQSLPEVADDE